MKICPTCCHQYGDESGNFCVRDGARLDAQPVTPAPPSQPQPPPHPQVPGHAPAFLSPESVPPIGQVSAPPPAVPFPNARGGSVLLLAPRPDSTWPSYMTQIKPGTPQASDPRLGVMARNPSSSCLPRGVIPIDPATVSPQLCCLPCGKASAFSG
jgi:hypothetical protein